MTENKFISDTELRTETPNWSLVSDDTSVQVWRRDEPVDPPARVHELHYDWRWAVVALVVALIIGAVCFRWVLPWIDSEVWAW